MVIDRGLPRRMGPGSGVAWTPMFVMARPRVLTPSMRRPQKEQIVQLRYMVAARRSRAR